MGLSRSIFLGLGVVLLLAAVGLLVFSIAMFSASSAGTDSNGFTTTETLKLQEESHAIVVERGDIHLRAAWVWDWGNLVDFRVEASSNDPSKQLFIGFTELDNFEAYFDDVEHDQITDFSIRPQELEFTNVSGNKEPWPAAPASIDNKPPYEEFWANSTSGAGTQILEVELEAEDYVLVLMNDDGTAGVDLDLKIGVKAPLIFGTAIAFLVAGIVSIVLVFVLFNYGIRGLPYSNIKGD